MAVASASAENTAIYSRKIIVVAGDTGVGKSHLIKAFLELNGSPDNYRQGVFYTYADCDFDVDGSKFTMIIYVTPIGEGDYNVAKQRLLEKADVVVLCFAVDNMSSFQSVTGEWLNDLKENSPTAPLVIAANKCDLRSRAPCVVSHRMGKKTARNMNAYKFIECSAFTKENVMEVFVAAVKATLPN